MALINSVGETSLVASTCAAWINGVAVPVGLGVGLARLLGSVYGRRNRIQTERLGAVLHITRQFGQRCAAGERRGLRDRQPVVDGRNRRRVRRETACAVSIGVSEDVSVVPSAASAEVSLEVGGSSRILRHSCFAVASTARSDTVRQIEQGIKPLVVAVPEGRVDEYERNAGVVGDERPAERSRISPRAAETVDVVVKLRRAADIIFAVQKLQLE